MKCYLIVHCELIQEGFPDQISSIITILKLEKKMPVIYSVQKEFNFTETCKENMLV